MLKLDFNYITTLIPDYYRRNKIRRLEWMGLTVNGVSSGHTSFIEDYDNYLYLAKHNYQSIIMEHVVNNILPVTTDIEIVDGSWLNASYWYNESEIFIDQEWMYNEFETGQTQLYLYNEVEFLEDQVDFFVLVDASDVNLESKIIYYIDLYKQGGKNYQIIYI